MQIITVNDLRTILAEQINRIRNNEATPAQVNAVTNATGKILSSIRMEIEYSKLVGITPQIDFISPPKPQLEEKL